jgi:hypothetical protein
VCGFLCLLALVIVVCAILFPFFTIGGLGLYGCGKAISDGIRYKNKPLNASYFLKVESILLPTLPCYKIYDEKGKDVTKEYADRKWLSVNNEGGIWIGRNRTANSCFSPLQEISEIDLQALINMNDVQTDIDNDKTV